MHKRERVRPIRGGAAVAAVAAVLLTGLLAEGARAEDPQRPATAHWSFTAPERPDPPGVHDERWVRSPIDRFILSRLEAEGLEPSPEADRHTLVRRLSLDLTGLPPTPEQVERFVNDTRPDAYERLVDRLLESPAYGERWAQVWLDLARYADTNGYEKDDRRTIWRYRDWVIDALNDDMPFDEFTIEQIAGDLLPKPTMEQRLATAFHRNTMTNTEGGTDNEEFRVAAVVDRVNTTGQVWMGLAMSCAQCHDHKYDAITQREYFELFAFFNQTADNDEPGNPPTMPTPTAEQRERMAALEAEIAGLRERLAAPSERAEEAQVAWEESVTAEADAGRWVVLEPVEVRAESGAAFETLDDGSIVVNADAERAETDTYTLTVRTDLAGITGFRLEALADDRLPGGGPGRAANGNFVVNGLRVKAEPAGSESEEAGEARPVALDAASASFEQDDGRWSAVDALRPEPESQRGWAVAPRFGESHHAVFQTADEVGPEGGTVLRFTLVQLYGEGHTLGRFRLAATTADRPVRAIPSKVRDILAVAPEERSDEQRGELATYYRRHVDPELRGVAERVRELEGRIAAMDIPTTPIMREVPEDERRTTYIHVRGNFRDPGEEVSEGVPAAFHPMPDGAPRNRLGIATWLVDEANPLTARVQANRFWSRLFGTGIVDTEEDFGSQGNPPSHPELLDWLAVEFMRNGWSMKQLLRTIVTSATYRQASAVSEELLEIDPDNRLLARGPRFRMDAEMIRDHALAASGLLSDKMHGPSVMPPQPEGVWQVVYSSDRWEASEGEDRYRRGLYTFLRRTAPYPSMTAFDATSREVCAVRRVRTNTPLQSLVTMNDPVYVEAAQALARRMAGEGGETAEERAAHGFRLVLVRPPSDEEVERLVALYRSELEHYGGDPSAAESMATDPLGPLPEGMAAEELAAWTVVANVLLNLDEVLTKG